VTPFQQYIGNVPLWDYQAYASDIRQINFQDGNGNILPSWLETAGTVLGSVSSTAVANVSRASYWINLPSSYGTISPNATVTIYLVINKGLVWDGTVTGAQPMATSTYGQYDNGASVFNYYWNFAGTSLPSGWVTSSSMSATVNNGVTLSASAGGQTFTYQANLTPPLTYEIYGKVITPSTLNANLVADIYYPLLSWHDQVGEGYNGNHFLYYAIGSTSYYTNIPWNTNIFYLDGISWDGSLTYMYVNYTQLGKDTRSTSYVNIRVWQGSTTTFIQWVRVRAYPPNGVMPVVNRYYCCLRNLL
jgi:hypothetical protein